MNHSNNKKGFTSLFYKRAGIILLLVVILFLTFRGFNSFKEKKNNPVNNNISGDLIIFHAGSLAVPMKELCDSFKKTYPDINIITEAAGSKACARKISDLNKRCDIFASADIEVIQRMLIPKWADTAYAFATNSMAIVFNEKSKYADIINADNWYKILSNKYVKTGRSDPDADPCGVRAILLAKLAEKYYNLPGLANKLLEKDTKYMRPKETDLLVLLETSTIDYIYLYKSVAIQHKLKYIELPDEINLGNKDFNDFYSGVYVETRGNKPNETVREYGTAMVYGITIPKTCENIEAAKLFLNYVLSTEGQKIMRKNGQ